MGTPGLNQTVFTTENMSMNCAPGRVQINCEDSGVA